MSDRMTDVRLREIENMSSYDKHVRSSALHKEMLAEIYALRNAVKAQTARADAAVASLAAAKGYMSKAALKRFMRSADVRNAVYPPEQTP